MQVHTSAGGRIQAAQQVQQRAFARAGRTHDGQRFAPVHLQIHTLQHRDIEPPLGKTLGQALARSTSSPTVAGAGRPNSPSAVVRRPTPMQRARY
jgi:hypothetical protein